MRIAGVWIGWGLNDWSHNPDGTDGDPTVRRFRAFARRMFAGYAGHLADNNKFDKELEDVVILMQSKLIERPFAGVPPLKPGNFVRGVLDLPTQLACKFKKLGPPVLPIIFTVEGHMSNMFQGPCAVTASILEAEQRCHWKPIGYNSTALPFDNASGWNAMFDQLSRTEIEGPPVDVNNPDGPKIMWPFGPEVPWETIIFSQGGIIGCEFMQRFVIPPGAPLHWRLKGFRRGLAFGNPYREKDVVAPWVPDPPKPGTQGISDKRFNTTQIVLPDGRRLSDFWREHSRTKDLYAENQTDEVGLNKTAVYKMVQREFTGNPASILARIWDLFVDPIDGLIDITRSIIDGGMFVANMGPHGTYDLGPAINWVREGLTA